MSKIKQALQLAADALSPPRNVEEAEALGLVELALKELEKQK